MSKWSASGELRQFREIESAFGEINSEERQEHRDAAEKSVEEKLGRGAVAILAAPDLDEEESRGPGSSHKTRTKG